MDVWPHAGKGRTGQSGRVALTYTPSCAKQTAREKLLYSSERSWVRGDDLAGWDAVVVEGRARRAGMYVYI